MRVLVVEDNALLRHHLKVQLQELGHQVDAAEDAREADYYLGEHLPDIAIVDLGLPDEDGLSLIRRWRSHDVSLPVLVLTAREGWQDKVEVLSAGADDYVTKPFHIEEVAARMQALLRRNSGLASQVISLPPFQVDLSRRELSVNDQPIKLTAFEYTIMETLIRNRGKVVSKDSLMLQLYPDAELRESHTIDVADGSAAARKFRLNTHRTSSPRCAARAICSNCADEGTVAAYLPAVITGSLPAGDRRGGAGALPGLRHGGPGGL
ncbi:DNA-binding transcriptional regulator PhoP [Klebsiella pneumoniae]|uniref:DNA-binding transcriptional regulator PhoP n=12 Tax=Enterobacteriaceae TaxID=543 RepID=A0A377WKX8_KLEPN|nr:DNA-binding transcriptional regulator PhoP [Klebsiella pneumoniae]